VRGDIVADGKVLVIRHIHVSYLLKAPAGQRETIARVHLSHHDACPVYRSLIGSIGITTDLRWDGGTD
jgi:uncharacterized OsmC-like protein